MTESKSSDTNTLVKTERTEIKGENYWVLVPYLGSYFILYGIVNLITYYSKFNINIFNYIGFSEIITYFIKDIYNIVLNIIVSFLLYYFLKHVFGKIEGKMIKVEKLLEKIKFENQELKMKCEENESLITYSDSLKSNKIDETLTLIKNEQKKKKRGIILKTLFFIFLFAFLICFLAITGGNSMYYIILTFLISLVFLYFKYKDLKLSIIFYSVLLLLSSDYYGAYLDAGYVLKGKGTDIKLMIDKRLYSSANSCYLIGNTEKYIFIFNKKEQKSIIFPHEKIDSIEVPLK